MNEERSASSIPAPGAEEPARAGVNPDLRMALNAVEGLDVEFGLRSLMGDPVKYCRMLQRFMESHRDDVGRMRDLLAKGEARDAHRLIHTLKGLSASLGAKRIQEAAAPLEASLKTETPDQEMAAELERRLVDLATVVRTLPCGEQPMNPPVTVDAVHRREVIDGLLALLAEDNMLANSHMQKNRAILEAILGVRYPELASLVEGYRYPQALALLKSQLRQP